MKLSRIVIVIAACALCTAVAVAITQKKMRASFENEISLWIEKSNIDQAFIEKIPIFEDYASKHNTNQLRKYLFEDHYKATLKTGMKPLSSHEQIKDYVEKKLLVPVVTDESSLFYFYGIKKENRYLTPMALSALEKTAKRFNEKLDVMGLPNVKLALSSALRPEDYQKNLRERNRNATPVSTHSYGMSFDLFFDDYYIMLPEPDDNVAGKISDRLRRRLGFMLGDSLRRQLHTVLFQTLTEMQDDGEIYAILEKRQHCYHITPTK